MAVSGSSKSGGGAKGVRAGAAYVEIFGVDNLSKVLDSVQAKTRAFASVITKVGAGMSGFGTGALGSVAGLFAAATGRATEFGRLADKLSVPVDKLSAFAFAAETTGQSLEDLSGHFENFQERIGQAAADVEGTGEAFNAFAKIGIDAKKLLPLDAVEQVIETLTRLKLAGLSASEELTVLSSLGSDQFQNLRNLANLGPDEIRARMGWAGEVGAVISQDQAVDANNVTLAWTAASTAVKSALLSVGAALLPESETVERFSGSLVNAAGRVREFIEDNRPLIIQGVAVAGAVAAAGSALLVLGPTLGGAAAAFGGLVAAAGPVGILTAAVVALAAAGGELDDTFAVLGGVAAETLSGLRDDLAQSVAGITAALRSGDVGRAAEVAFAAVEVAWARTTKAMKVAFEQLLFEIQEAGFAAGYALEAGKESAKKGTTLVVAEGILSTVTGVLGPQNAEKVRRAFEDRLGEMEAQDQADLKEQYEREKQIRKNVHELELSRLKESNDAEKAALQRLRGAVAGASVGPGALALGGGLLAGIGTPGETAQAVADGLGKYFGPRPAFPNSAAAGALIGGFGFLGADPGRAGLGGADGMRAMADAGKKVSALGSQVRGRFGGNSAKSAFAFADKNSDAAQKTATNTKDTADRLKDLNDAVKSGALTPRFG
jgi:hypothetical protein